MAVSVILFVSVIGLVISYYGVEGGFVVEKESISVLSPSELRYSKHDASIGNFGVPDYGGTMVGSVVFPQKGSHGCNSFDGDKPFKSKSSRPVILLLDRGGNFYDSS